jgi:hypothetical protein
VANWRSVVNGFSFHHMTERGSGCEEYPVDSVHVVAGVSNLYGPMVEWLARGGSPFTEWLYPCHGFGDVLGESHLSGPVTCLHQSRPNPFNTRAMIRFSLASAGEVDLTIYDVAGRLAKPLMHGEASAGESSLTWDGTDGEGNRVGAGVFWMQMTTHDGFSSGRKMLLMR